MSSAGGGPLAGRTAVVTGAGRGIGAAIAKALGAAGAAVVVADLGVALDGSGRDAGPAQAVTAEIRARGGQAVAIAEDVVDHAAASRMIDVAVDTFGGLDILVNAAGILRDRMIFNMTPQEWDAVIAVHLRGAFNTTSHAARYWRAHADPGAHRRLINITSTSGLHGAPGQPNYAAAKMGIVGFTFSCANALGRYGVTANAVSPAAITRMSDSSGQDGWRLRDLAAGSQLSPEHVARAVAYLASPASSWLTGQVLHVQGGSVSLYSTPAAIRTVRVAEEAEAMGDALEREFRPLLDLNHTSDIK